MSDYFASMPLDTAQQIEELSRLAFDLREGRRRLLAQYGVDDEEGLLEKIAQGAVPAHPASEHCASARELGTAREAVRAELRAVLDSASTSWTR